jgi:hypothetical protein
MRPVALTLDPAGPPHVCIKCGAHAQIRKWFVDIGTETEWEGIVYICNSCMADIVKVTPDFLSVEAHREIVAEYMRGMDELAELKNRLEIVSALWMDMTGNSLEVFMDNLEKVHEYSRLELSGVVSDTISDLSTTLGDSSESESSDSSSVESDRDVDPSIIVFG